jgi:hypothetical protein
LGKIEPGIEQRGMVAVAQCGKDRNLAAIDLAHLAAPLAGDPDGVFAFFGEGSLVDKQATVRRPAKKLIEEASVG